MKPLYLSAALIAGAVILAAPFASVGQTAAPPASPPAFVPGLGDLMTDMVQPRHIKLGIAVKEKNWAYAAYELHELQEAFDRVAMFRGDWRGKPIAQMVKTVTKEPMSDLDQAIKASDGDKFSAAYQRLTGACNACHIANERPMVVIKVPDAAAYPDQNFQAKH